MGVIYLPLDLEGGFVVSAYLEGHVRSLDRGPDGLGTHRTGYNFGDAFVGDAEANKLLL